MERVPVCILSGGRSSRFGSDKARALLRFVPLIVHVVRTAESVASRVTVVADTADKYAGLGLKTIVDLTPGLGPIGGLNTVLVPAPPCWITLQDINTPGDIANARRFPAENGPS